jgi:hypothetical protein
MKILAIKMPTGPLDYIGGVVRVASSPGKATRGDRRPPELRFSHIEKSRFVSADMP